MYILRLLEDKLRIFNTITIKLLVYLYLQNNAYSYIIFLTKNISCN